VEFPARQKALAAPVVQSDNELKAVGTKELALAKEQLEKALKRAYQHVVYLAQPDPDGERYLDQISFDDEHSSALDGTIVWKALAERDKVFDAGQFTAKALVRNLRDSDYGKTLSDIRAAFYSAPRMPLLYSGDHDLQQAIHDAVAVGLVDIVDGTGAVVAVTAPNQVNLLSAGLRLARPQPKICPTCGQPAHAGPCEPDQPTHQPLHDGQPPDDSHPPDDSRPTEQQIAFTFMRNLLTNPNDADQFAALFETLYMSLDERQISYLQGTLQLVVDPATAEEVRQRLAELGVPLTVKDI
jgi:hypothetical protein